MRYTETEPITVGWEGLSFYSYTGSETIDFVVSNSRLRTGSVRVLKSTFLYVDFSI